MSSTPVSAIPPGPQPVKKPRSYLLLLFATGFLSGGIVGAAGMAWFAIHQIPQEVVTAGKSAVQDLKTSTINRIRDSSLGKARDFLSRHGL